MSQMYPWKFLHNTTFSFNYSTLPATPFKRIVNPLFTGSHCRIRMFYNNFTSSNYPLVFEKGQILFGRMHAACPQVYPLIYFVFLLNFRILENLKGVFAKNERGYRLSAIKKRFWSLLILLPSVASLRRKMLKTTTTNNNNKNNDNNLIRAFVLSDCQKSFHRDTQYTVHTRCTKRK